MENNKNQTPVTEEVKEWSIDFMRSVETEGYESMVRKLNELTPELRVGVLEFLKTVTDYCVKNNLKDFLEGVDNYKKLISTKEVNLRKYWRPKSIYVGTKDWSCYEKMLQKQIGIPIFEIKVG